MYTLFGVSSYDFGVSHTACVCVNRSAVDFCENFTPFSIVACCRFEFGRLKYDFRK